MSSSSPALRRAALAVVVAGAVVSLSACGVLNSFLGEGNVMEIGVGDCFTDSEMRTAMGGGEVDSVPVVDCSEPHDAEVFHAEDLPDGDYPGNGSVSDSVDEVCTGSAFGDFVGVDFEESEFYVGGFSPTVESWDLIDDREILCYVMSDGGPVTESLEGANR